MMRCLARNVSFLIGTAVIAGHLAGISAARADPASPMLVDALVQAQGCETALNDTLQEGSRCLLGPAANFALGQAVGLARERGKAAFGQYFQVVGDLRYTRASGRTGLQGDLDSVTPLVGGEPMPGQETLQSALFLQHGITRWWDAHDSLHNDVRQGLVYRFRVSEESHADIVGVSMLHLVNAEQRHEVLVPGFDYSGKWGSGSFRYFIPTTDWRPVRPGYEARALEGMELAMDFDITSTIRLSPTGYRWQSEDGLGRWVEGARLSIGWRPHPWLNIAVGYERPSDGKGTTSVLARFTIPIGSPSRTPGWEGAGLMAAGAVPDDSELWRPIEGVGQIRLATRAAVSSLVSGAEIRFLQDAVNSGDVVELEVVLPDVAPEDIRVEVSSRAGKRQTILPCRGKITSTSRLGLQSRRVVRVQECPFSSCTMTICRRVEA